jgi:hypothetical protein
MLRRALSGEEGRREKWSGVVRRRDEKRVAVRRGEKWRRDERRGVVRREEKGSG